MRPSKALHALLALLALAAWAAGPQAAAAELFPLPPFSKVRTCVPFSVRILASDSAETPAPLVPASFPSSSGAAADDPAAPPPGAPRPAYSLTIDVAPASDAGALAAVNYSVAGDTLTLVQALPLVTNSCLTATIALPATALREASAPLSQCSMGGAGWGWEGVCICACYTYQLWHALLPVCRSAP